MTAIRRIRDADVDACVIFGVEAFRPIFASFEAHYGEGLFNALRPDWENAQSAYIRTTITSSAKETWVSVVDDATGFVVLVPNVDSGLGEIELMAVDPAWQGRGIGAELTRFAVDRFRELGMTHAFVGTADDDSHAPARAAYEAAGFTRAAIQSVHMAMDLGHEPGH